MAAISGPSSDRFSKRMRTDSPAAPVPTTTLEPSPPSFASIFQVELFAFTILGYISTRERIALAHSNKEEISSRIERYFQVESQIEGLFEAPQYVQHLSQMRRKLALGEEVGGGHRVIGASFLSFYLRHTLRLPEMVSRIQRAPYSLHIDCAGCLAGKKVILFQGFAITHSHRTAQIGCVPLFDLNKEVSLSSTGGLVSVSSLKPCSVGIMHPERVTLFSLRDLQVRSGLALPTEEDQSPLSYTATPAFYEATVPYFTAHSPTRFAAVDPSSHQVRVWTLREGAATWCYSSPTGAATLWAPVSAGIFRNEQLAHLEWITPDRLLCVGRGSYGCVINFEAESPVILPFDHYAPGVGGASRRDVEVSVDQGFFVLNSANCRSFWNADAQLQDRETFLRSSTTTYSWCFKFPMQIVPVTTPQNTVLTAINLIDRTVIRREALPPIPERIHTMHFDGVNITILAERSFYSHKPKRSFLD